MSDDFDIDLTPLFDGVAEFFGDIFGSSSSSSSAPALAPAVSVAPEGPKSLHVGYEVGKKFRVKENEWYDAVTTDMVLVVADTVATHVVFKKPNGYTFMVPIGMLSDFERIEPDVPTGQQSNKGHEI
ncbi:hypothetical protein LU11_gp048 [Pseudomonas phage Lu11]|uniref:hypothetical protein n=1 Tax=Pseudomonas phage Lu11 TaxID=1161927 RepID=UPI00025F150A|nr:hypothetical protein LU11_gp048 [Pseudomonas phage Lu11]AFH14579.1 hypothetical protein Lu11_0048 [Pseudomonas phage Lu11]